MYYGEELTSKEETTNDGTNSVGSVDQTESVGILIKTQLVICSESESQHTRSPIHAFQCAEFWQALKTAAS